MNQFYLIVSVVVISCCLSSGQMIEEDRELLILKNLFDQHIKILEYLEGLQEKVTSLETKIDSLEEHRAENQLCAKQDQLEDFKNTYVSGKQEMVTSVERSSCSDQLLDLQVLLTADECEDGSHNCSEMATCEDRPMMYKCTCSPGYFGDGFTCTDIDECQRGQHQCQSPNTCINIDGSYECQCTPPYKRDGDSCKFVCESPSLLIRELGCITLLREEITWSEAKVQCELLGMRLLEDIKREHFDLLGNHFTDLRTRRADVWIGFQKSQWISNGRSVSYELVGVGEGDLEGNCGAFDVDGSNIGLWDAPCENTLNSLCQKNL